MKTLEYRIGAMDQIARTSQFKRDVNKVLKRNKDHQLKGGYRDCRDCHIEPDWILIYRVKDNELHLVRTGTHADLF